MLLPLLLVGLALIVLALLGFGCCCCWVFGVTASPPKRSSGRATFEIEAGAADDLNDLSDLSDGKSRLGRVARLRSAVRRATERRQARLRARLAPGDEVLGLTHQDDGYDDYDDDAHDEDDDADYDDADYDDADYDDEHGELHGHGKPDDVDDGAVARNGPGDGKARDAAREPEPEDESEVI